MDKFDFQFFKVALNSDLHVLNSLRGNYLAVLGLFCKNVFFFGRAPPSENFPSDVYAVTAGDVGVATPRRNANGGIF